MVRYLCKTLFLFLFFNSQVFALSATRSIDQMWIYLDNNNNGEASVGFKMNGVAITGCNKFVFEIDSETEWLYTQLLFAYSSSPRPSITIDYELPVSGTTCSVSEVLLP